MIPGIQQLRVYGGSIVEDIVGYRHDTKGNKGDAGLDRSFAIGEATYFNTNGKIMIKTMIYVMSTLQSGQWNV